MVTQATYIEHLLSTLRNYTCTHLAEHLPAVSHDQVNRFLRRSSLSPSQLQELVLPLLDVAFAFTLTQQLVEATTRTRWQVEEFHRSFKQLTGAERCQCRRAQAQRNHLACCYLA